MDSEFTTDDGNAECLVMQIAEVNKAVGSVSYMVDQGFKVLFDKDPKTGHDLSMMIHKATGRTSRFRRERNVWVLDAYVSDGNVINGTDGDQVFGRHPLAPGSRRMA